MKSETAQPMNVANLSEAEIQQTLMELRFWEKGLIPIKALDIACKAWPEFRTTVMEEWEQALTQHNPELLPSMLSTVGWYVASAQRDVSLLGALLEGLFLEEDLCDELFGDTLIQHGSAWMALMASKSAEGIRLLEAAAMPRADVDPILNFLPLEALGILVFEERYQRADFDRLISKIIESLSGSNFKKDAASRREWIVNVLGYVGPGIYTEDCRRWFEEGLLEEGFMSIVELSWFEECAARNPGDEIPYWMGLNMYRMIPEDLYSAMQWLERLGSDEDDDLPENLDDDFLDELATEYLPQPSLPKIGRNDPCPCASGKKYKKCCGAIVPLP